MRHLRWLSLLGFLGFAGIFGEYQMFRILFVFFAFLVLLGYDERKDAIFKQAATVAFVVTTITIACTFIYFGMIGKNCDRSYLLTQFGLAMAITYIVHVMTFVFTYLYFEVRGFRQ